MTDSVPERHAPGVSCLRPVTHAPDVLSLPADVFAPAITSGPPEASSPTAPSSGAGPEDDPCPEQAPEDLDSGPPSFVLSPSMLSLAQASGYQSAVLSLPGACAIMQGEACNDPPQRRHAMPPYWVPATWHHIRILL